MEQQLYSESELDKTLKEGGVKFLPWIGKDYENGINYDEGGKLVFGTKEKPGKKVLILGESHYIEDYDPDDERNMQMTRNVFGKYLHFSNERQRWMSTFLKFERSLFNRAIESEETCNLWNHLSFYTYLTVPVYDLRMRAAEEDYDNSVEAFLTVLHVLAPDYIIVWGNRLYDYLPSLNGEPYKQVVYDGYESYTWSFKLDGKRIHMMAVNHPSVAYDWAFWHQMIYLFIGQ